jgi:hypothetical protein
MGEHSAWPWIRVAALWCALCGASCTGGTDTGNPLTDLDISECKADREETLAAQRSALILPDSARYDGLNCYVAQRSEDAVELDVYNFGGGCHIRWDANGRARGDELAIVLTNPSCAVAGCGSCLYDASFSLDLGATARETIELIDQPCEGDAQTLGAWDVPERDGASTLRCSFARGADWHAAKLGLCGQENQPCRNGGLCSSGPADGASACDRGLSCTQVSEHDSRCLKECSSADDCALPSAMRCEDGVCRL